MGDDHAGAAPAADEAADFLPADAGEDEDDDEAQGVDADDAKVDELEARATGTLMAGRPARLAGTVIRSSEMRRVGVRRNASDAERVTWRKNRGRLRILF